MRQTLILILATVLVAATFQRSAGGQGILYPIVDSSGQAGYIDKSGKVIDFDTEFRATNEFGDGVGIVFTDQGNGYVTGNGEITLFKNTEIISPTFSDGLVFAKTKDGMGFINKAGQLVIKVASYKEPVGFSSGIGGIYQDGAYYIDATGKRLFNRNFDEIYGFSDGVAVVVKNGHWRVINKSGENIWGPQNQDIATSSNGLTNVGLMKDKWRFIDRNGRVVLTVEYDDVGSFHDGMARALIGNKWGFIGKDGHLVIPPIYEKVNDFSEGLAAVVINDRLGFINTDGKMVIDPKFDTIPVPYKFNGGLVYVYQQNTEGYIDVNGKWIWQRDR